MRKLRDEAVRENNIDLVVGHHTHVAGGIQRVGRKVILYGLGNLLHLGMQDMAKFGQCRDFGLVVRLHLQRDAKKRLRAAAIEAIPLTRMHAVAEPRRASAAAKRIAVLNGLAGELDHKASGAQGVRFKVNSQGHGVYCFPTADGQSTSSLAICKDQGTRLRDVGVVRCPRLSNSVLARSSRNRSERKKLRRRTARNAARTRAGVRDPFSGSGFGD